MRFAVTITKGNTSERYVFDGLLYVMTHAEREETSNPGSPMSVIESDAPVTLGFQWCIAQGRAGYVIEAIDE